MELSLKYRASHTIFLMLLNKLYLIFIPGTLKRSIQDVFKVIEILYTFTKNMSYEYRILYTILLILFKSNPFHSISNIYTRYSSENYIEGVSRLFPIRKYLK